MEFRQAERGITALYERLSRDDEQQGDSNSIVNQKKMLEEYAARNGFQNVAHYTDDGYSGGSFDRPDWKRMMADIEAGKITTVIAKDMSRIGRNYLEVGYYTEIYFRQKDIHFIAIANGVDSDNRSSEEFTPFLNVMNEWYLRDTSRKIKASRRAIGLSGVHLSGQALYGYRKDPADKHKWLIDEEAAAVVRRMYQMVVDGKGTTEIASILTKEKVETPSYYHAKQGIGQYKNRIDDLNPYTWNGTTVKYILTRPEYMGYTVNFKTESKSYKEKTNIINPPEKWAVFENTQEAIVDTETWHLVQKLLGTPRKKSENGAPNPLTGLVFCADCGSKMYNKRATAGISASGKQRHTFDCYECSNYKMRTLRTHTAEKCATHHINTNDLRDLILYTIREVCTFALADNESFRQKVMEAAALRQAEAVKDRRRRLNRDKRRFADLDVLYKKLYESYAMEKIPESKFDELSRDYLAEQDALKISIAEAEAEIAEYEQNADNAEQFLAVAQKYTDFSELMTPMINEFIEKIVVHAPDRSNGPRQQQVDIHLKFIGHFIPPEREPTLEELEEMKRKQFWLDKYWKNRDYELARRKKQKEKELEGQAEAEAKRHEERVAAVREEVRMQAEKGELSVIPK